MGVSSSIKLLAVFSQNNTWHIPFMNKYLVEDSFKYFDAVWFQKFLRSYQWQSWQDGASHWYEQVAIAALSQSPCDRSCRDVKVDKDQSIERHVSWLGRHGRLINNKTSLLTLVSENFWKGYVFSWVAIFSQPHVTLHVYKRISPNSVPMATT